MKDQNDVVQEFNDIVNMSASELEQWLKSDDSNSAGWAKDEGDGESVGHDSGRKITEILKANPNKDPEKYTEDQIEHMRKVVSYCKRHLAQEEQSNAKKSTEEVKKTKSYASLKNWGHDPLKKRGDSKKDNSDKQEEEDDKEDASEEKQAGTKRKQGNGTQAKSNKTRKTRKSEEATNGSNDDDEGDEEDGDGKDEDGDEELADADDAAEDDEEYNEEEDEDDDDGEEEEEEEADNNDDGEKRQTRSTRQSSRKQAKSGSKSNGSSNKKTNGSKTNGAAKSNGQKKSADDNDEKEDNDDVDDDDGKAEKNNGGGDGKTSKKGPKPGDTVSWNWGSGQPQGKVLDVKAEKTSIETKNGNEVSRDGDPEDPAVVLDTGKSKAIKSNHELN